MGAALIPGTSNVFRFPVESRVKVPSIEWIYDLKPDCRMVDQVAEAWGFEVPSWDLYDEADRAMAEHIANHVRPERDAWRKRYALHVWRDRAFSCSCGRAISNNARWL